MNLHLRAIRHESDERVLRQQSDRAAERGLDESHLFLDHAGVEDEEEDGGGSRRRRRQGIEGGGGIGVGGEGEGVLDGGVVGVELAGEVGVGDHGVVRREVVALEAEGADPDLGGEVDATEGVEDGGAGLAAERGVREGGDLRVGADRGDHGGEWDHALAGLNLRAWPRVPRHPDAVDALGIGARHLRHPERERERESQSGFCLLVCLGFGM